MSGVSLTVKQYQRLNAERRRAFMLLAKALGKKHPLVTLMDGLAWGRHRYELGPGDAGKLRKVAEEFGALNGYREILAAWARDNDRDALRVLCNTIPTGYNEAVEP